MNESKAMARRGGQRARTPGLEFLSMLACLAGAAASAGAEGPGGHITPNFKDAEISQVTEAVSAATGKNFIIDPRVRAQVTMLSSTPMSAAALYEAFLAILQVHGFIAVPSGNIVKILPDANARQIPSVDLPERVSATSDEIVTQVIDVKNVSAAQLVPILRPMIPQYGHLAAYPASNILIVSDRANNVNRMIRIIRRIDQVGDQDVEIVPLESAGAADIVRVLNSLLQQAAAAEGGVALKVVADERSNSVLISGDHSQRLRVRALVAHLDTPLKAGGETQVRYLRYADAEKIAPKLKEQITGIAQQPAGSAGAVGGATPQAQAEKNAMVWADPSTNSLIITAPPRIMRAVIEIIDKLDIRRAQVLVEAVIVEVNSDKTADLGVNWAAWSNGTNGSQIPIGAFVSPVGGSSIVDLASAAYSISSGSTTSTSSSGTTGATGISAIPTGATFGIGRISSNGINFAATLRAVRGDANTNVIATPSAVTMDNQEAELKVAQEVPFITGQYTSTGSSTGTVTPFTTVQRQEVGTILKVTPQIAAEGDSVVLKISIESSSVATTSVSTVDITTNKRTISTNVLIEDGGIVVLGGLIQDNVTKSEQHVPLLASIPLIGQLFRTRDVSATKNNLMVFIRPKILRTAEQTAIETGAKYNYMRDEQREANKADRHDLVPLLPGDKPPLLSPLPPRPAEPRPDPAKPQTSKREASKWEPRVPRDKGSAGAYSQDPEPQGSDMAARRPSGAEAGDPKSQDSNPDAFPGAAATEQAKQH